MIVSPAFLALLFFDITLANMVFPAELEPIQQLVKRNPY
jgi:hypothetical protein